MSRAAPALVVLALAARALADVPSTAPSQQPAGARIWSRGQTTWIHAEPKRAKNALGYIRLGQSLALRPEAPVKGPGCSGQYYPVEPYGWVCQDRIASTSGDGRWLRAMAVAAPRQELMPFDYALSNGAPMYRRLPTRAEVQREASSFGKAGDFKPQSWGNRGHERLAEVRPIAGNAAVPWFLANGGSAGEEKPLEALRRQIPHGSMLAYATAFSHDGRSYVLSSDGTVVPADRVRPFRVSDFRGVELGKAAELPIAFFRARARPKLRRAGDGFEPTGASFAARSWARLDESIPALEARGKRYLATRERIGDEPVWVSEDDATVIRKREHLPIGVAPGSKWLLHSITQGTLVAFEDTRAVFATLASPGAGGVPVKGKDPVKMSTTPLGVYRITFKHRATTMSPEYGENRKFWIADVPYTQYFNAPFALHTAYWHDEFGEPMSAGCVNVSPLDGKWLFDWTSPAVPPGWGGSGPGGRHGAGTYVVIAR